MTKRELLLPGHFPDEPDSDNDAPDGSLLSAILPFQTIPWILLLLFILPLVVIAGDSLLSPLYTMFWLTLFPSSDTMAHPEFSFILLIKLAVFFPLAFLAVGLLLTKILTAYHRAWTQFIAQPHALHQTYHPNKQYSPAALVNWVIYRWYRLLRGPLLFLVLGSVLLGVQLFLLQWFAEPLALVFMIGFIVVLFALFLVTFFFVLSLAKSSLQYFKTSFGSTAAILEPEQTCEVLYQRVSRIAFNSPWVFMVTLQQIGLVAVFWFSVTFTTTQYDAQSFLSFDPGLLKLFFLNAIVLMVLLVLFASKFFLYSDALSRFYEGLSGTAGMSSGHPRFKSSQP
jgi:hypothetical protein